MAAKTRVPLLLTLALVAGATALSASTNAKKTLAEKAGQQALSQFQVFVGGWRGVGLVRRGSTSGSWLENADWAWKFDANKAVLVFSTPKGKYFSSGVLAATSKKGQYQLVATLPDGKTRETYTGAPSEDGRLILTADKPADGRPARISLRTVAKGDRLLVLFERRLGKSDRYLRLAEVGYTRKGSSFGKGTVQRECVVTGGAGTMAVTFEGKTYYVCCTGCRDLFNEDPAGALAEYRERKAAEKRKAAKQE